MPKFKPGAVWPTMEEEAAIQAGIASDSDTRVITTEENARMRPADEMIPEVVDRWRRARGKQKAPTKTQITLRLDADLVAHFRNHGKGWQTRLNNTLRKAVFDSD